MDSISILSGLSGLQRGFIWQGKGRQVSVRGKEGWCHRPSCGWMAVLWPSATVMHQCFRRTIASLFPAEQLDRQKPSPLPSVPLSALSQAVVVALKPNLVQLEKEPTTVGASVCASVCASMWCFVSVTCAAFVTFAVQACAFLFQVEVLNKSSGFKRLNQAAVLTLPSLSLQVYLINVTYSDNTSHIIYRRYSKFFDLQVIPHQPRPALLPCVGRAWIEVPDAAAARWCILQQVERVNLQHCFV